MHREIHVDRTREEQSGHFLITTRRRQQQIHTLKEGEIKATRTREEQGGHFLITTRLTQKQAYRHTTSKEQCGHLITTRLTLKQTDRHIQLERGSAATSALPSDLHKYMYIHRERG